MEITRTCPFTGGKVTRDIDVTQEQLDDWAVRRMLIQNAMPHLSADEREFIQTGISQAAWDKYVKPSEDEEPGPAGPRSAS